VSKKRIRKVNEALILIQSSKDVFCSFLYASLFYYLIEFMMCFAVSWMLLIGNGF